MAGYVDPIDSRLSSPQSVRIMSLLPSFSDRLIVRWSSSVLLLSVWRRQFSSLHTTRTYQTAAINPARVKALISSCVLIRNKLSSALFVLQVILKMVFVNSVWCAVPKIGPRLQPILNSMTYPTNCL